MPIIFDEGHDWLRLADFAALAAARGAARQLPVLHAAARIVTPYEIMEGVLRWAALFCALLGAGLVYAGCAGFLLLAGAEADLDEHESAVQAGLHLGYISGGSRVHLGRGSRRARVGGAGLA